MIANECIGRRGVPRLDAQRLQIGDGLALAMPTTRRQFLSRTVYAGAGLWVFRGSALGETGSAPSGRARRRRVSSNEKLRIACIGGGGQGYWDILAVGKRDEIVAIADVDFGMAYKAFKAFPKARQYKDFRKMLEEMNGQIDAVTVSIPDHQHAVAAMMAMRMGKHVFVQKPLAHDIWEVRQLVQAARKYGVVTQMGNHGTANNRFREAVEVVWSGAIGQVREVHVWSDRPFWPTGVRRPDVRGGPLDRESVLGRTGGGIRSASDMGMGIPSGKDPDGNLGPARYGNLGPARDGSLGPADDHRSPTSTKEVAHPVARQKVPDPVPPTMDWDLWLGTAPERPYSPESLTAPTMGCPNRGLPPSR